MITSLALQPIYGRTSDHIGRKIPYITASFFFAFGIILCAFSPNWSALVASRALCGVGAAGVSTMGKLESPLKYSKPDIPSRVCSFDRHRWNREKGLLPVNELSSLWCRVSVRLSSAPYLVSCLHLMTLLPDSDLHLAAQWFKDGVGLGPTRFVLNKLSRNNESLSLLTRSKYQRC